MNRKAIILSSLAVSSLTAVALVALSSTKTLNKLHAETNEYSITFDASCYWSFANTFRAYTKNGNQHLTTSANAAINPGEDIMYSLRDNGAGFYTLNPIQAITSVSITYSIGIKGYCSFYLSEDSQMYSGQCVELVNGNTEKQTLSIEADNPETAHYITIWNAGSGMNIYSVTIYYTCA